MFLNFENTAQCFFPITTTTQELVSYNLNSDDLNFAFFPDLFMPTALALMHVAPKYLADPQSLTKTEENFVNKFSIFSPHPKGYRSATNLLRDEEKHENHPYIFVAVEEKRIYIIFNPELGKTYKPYSSNNQLDETVIPIEMWRTQGYIDPRTTNKKGYYSEEKKSRTQDLSKDHRALIYSGLIRKTFYDYAEYLGNLPNLIEDIIHQKEVSGEYHLQKDTDQVTVCLAGSGIGAGFAEACALRLKAQGGGHLNTRVFSFNPPYMVGKKDINSLGNALNSNSIWESKEVSSENYFPMTLNTDYKVRIPDHKSQLWLKRQGLRAIPTFGNINVQDWSSSWGTQICYPFPKIMDFFPHSKSLPQHIFRGK